MVVASEDAQLVWQSLLEQEAVPCGLGARDVLRLEAGLPRMSTSSIWPGVA